MSQREEPVVKKRLPLLPKHTLKVQRLKYKTRDSGYQREEEKGQQVREVKGGVVLEAHLRRDVTLSWILSGLVGA